MVTLSDFKMEELKYRWLEKNDVSKIEFSGNTKKDIRKKLSLVNTFGIIVEKEEIVIAYFIYKSFKNKIKILDIFVKEENRRCGVGRDIINYILEKHNNKDLEIMSPEENLYLQLFLKNQNFLATEIREEKSGDIYYKFSRKC